MILQVKHSASFSLKFCWFFYYTYRTLTSNKYISYIKHFRPKINASFVIQISKFSPIIFHDPRVASNRLTIPIHPNTRSLITWIANHPNTSLISIALAFEKELQAETIGPSRTRNDGAREIEELSICSVTTICRDAVSRRGAPSWRRKERKKERISRFEGDLSIRQVSEIASNVPPALGALERVDTVYMYM